MDEYPTSDTSAYQENNMNARHFEDKVARRVRLLAASMILSPRASSIRGDKIVEIKWRDHDPRMARGITWSDHDPEVIRAYNNDPDSDFTWILGQVDREAIKRIIQNVLISRSL